MKAIVPAVRTGMVEEAGFEPAPGTHNPGLSVSPRSLPDASGRTFLRKRKKIAAVVDAAGGQSRIRTCRLLLCLQL